MCESIGFTLDLKVLVNYFAVNNFSVGWKIIPHDAEMPCCQCFAEFIAIMNNTILYDLSL